MRPTSVARRQLANQRRGELRRSRLAARLRAELPVAVAGRADDDRAKEREAVAAMATATSWPVLHEMEEGAYPDVLYEFAAAMPEGEWYGRPLTGNSGLGCDGLGVDLP